MKSPEHFGVTAGQLRALVAEGLRDGGDWCDLYFEDTAYHDLLLRDGEVASGGYHVDYGCGIRVLKGEKTGYAYAETTDFPSLLSAAKAAGAIADSATAGAVKTAAASGNTATLGTLRGGTASEAQRWGRAERDVFGGELQNRPVSSTKIREALERGDVEAANAMLGYAYGLRGVVVGGKQLGRTIGFPTANLRLYDPLKMIPARGVYLTEVEVLGRHHWGMTNVGDVIETHIFDFDEDIYGLDLAVRFRRYLRPMRTMESLEALKTQLAADEAACRESLPFIK